MNKRSLIRAVIFDMDGVLTDSEPLINEAAIAMFKERGLTVQPQDFAPATRLSERQSLGISILIVLSAGAVLGGARPCRFHRSLAAIRGRDRDLRSSRRPSALVLDVVRRRQSR